MIHRRSTVTAVKHALLAIRRKKPLWYDEASREVAFVGGSTTWHYRVVFTRDPVTASVVAEIPPLQVADFGADVPEALERLQAMVTFHLDCLVQEGKPIPT